MRTVPVIFAILATALSAKAAPPTWQELTSRLFTNSPIVWQAPTNHLPKSFWVYKRSLPHVFSATVISNAIVLGSLQSKGFPRPTTNDFFIPEDKCSSYPGPCLTIFGIRPADANIYYFMPNYGSASGKDIPDSETVVRRAWQCASQLELDTTKLVQKSAFTNVFENDAGSHTSNYVCGRGVFLSRQLDGVGFFSPEDTSSDGEGFYLELGSQGRIRSFSLRWSEMTRHENQVAASAQEIVDCIKAHKTIVLPNAGEEDFFARLKLLAAAKKLTVTKITPCYGEGLFGEVPTNDVPFGFAMPFAELEVIADFENSNSTVRLFSPITSSEVKRLMKRN